MDFHSLTRRELQALCKKNKIPANTTNIAMADALKALEIVEGMEEMLKPCESETAQSSVESPEKTVVPSPSVPRTGCRTSTWRKAIQEEPKSSQILTRTRCGTRRTIAGDGENTKLDVPKTPAMPSSRNRAPVASARRKMETQLKGEAENEKTVPETTTRRRGTGASVRRNMETQLKEEAENEKNVPETPADTTTRRRATGASARRKMETKGDQKEETSVLQVYSTRRTTRLLEKKMIELNLNDNEGVEPTSDKEMPKDLERNVKEDSDDFGKASEVQGMHQQTISDDVLVKTDDFEAPSDKKSDLLSYNVRELEDNIQECIGDNHEIDDLKAKPQPISELFNESNIVLVSDEQTDRLTIEKEKEVDDENKDDEDDSQTKSRVGCESYGESDILSAEKDDFSEKEGCDDSGFDTFLSDIENPIDCLVSENEEGLNADKDLGLKDSAAVLSSGSICGDAIDLLVAPLQSSVLQETNHSLSEEPVVDDDLVSEDSAKTEFDVSASAAAEDQKQQNVELNDVQDLEFGLATKEPSDEEDPCDDAETGLEAYGVQDLESTFTGDGKSKSKVLVDDAVFEFDHPEHSIVSKKLENETVNSEEEPDQLDIESSNEDESDSEKSDIIESAVLVAIDAEIDFDHSELNIGSKQFENEEHPTLDTVNCGEQPDQLVIESSNEDESDSEKSATMESAAQVAIHPSVEESMMFSVNQISSCPVISENDIIEQLEGQESMISCAEVSVDMPFATLATDPLPGQMSSNLLDVGLNSDRVTWPASKSPMMKSASKTPTTSRKINNLLDDNKDKENIDKSGKKLDLTKEKQKKDKKELINDKSLRQLRKIFKEKLQITNGMNTNEEKNIAKVGRARPALQTLSENRLPATDPENEN